MPGLSCETRLCRYGELPPRGAGSGLATPEVVRDVGRRFAWCGRVWTGRVSPQDIGKNIYTIRDVVNEIRDKATRRRLAVLPYELRFKEPFPEYVRLGECLCPGVDGEAGPQPTRSGPTRMRVEVLDILSAFDSETARSRRSWWQRGSLGQESVRPC